MAKSVRQVYGTALFDAGQKAGEISLLRNEAEFLLTTYAGDRSAMDFLSHPGISPEEKIARLLSLFPSDGSMRSKTLSGFFSVLLEKKREGELAEILRTFLSIADREEGVGHVKVTTARALTEEEKKKCEKRMSETASLPTLDFTYVVDPRVLGGMKIELRDRVVDGTVANKMRRLSRELLSLHVD